MDRLAAIDTATLDDLARIKGEEEALLARLDRLEQRRGETSPAVFARIEADYRGRLAELAPARAPDERPGGAKLRGSSLSCSEGGSLGRIEK